MVKTIALAIIFAAIAFAGLIWLCRYDPTINFLPPDQRAEWILFPTAVDASARRVVNLDAIFRREFPLEAVPQKALLSFRAFRRIELKLNGRNIDVVATKNWKDVSVTDISNFLRSGPNTIEVRVFNDNGPPALWLSLTSDQLSLRSDKNWTTSFAGSAWRQSALASSPRFPGPGNPIYGGETTLSALAKVWPIWLLFGAGALVVWAAGSWWFHRQPINPDCRAGIVVLCFAAFWAILFWNNTRTMPLAFGFDASHHLDYIKYIQQHHTLPLPNQGVEMFQPPLFYIGSAVALSLFNLSVGDPSGILVLRALTMFFGIVQFILVFFTLRLICPGRANLQLVGVGLAAFLPMQLYLSHYPTNETLAGCLSSVSVYLCLRILIKGDNSWKSHALLGLIVGAALLTKVTAVLVVPFIVLALAKQLAAERAAASTWLRNLGSTILIAVLISSWHYIRISKYGSPLVGGWEPDSGLVWWQDDGYRTISYFLRFGESLIRPLFSVTASLPDGLYSTFWGDGLCGGVMNLLVRPPWNYNLIGAGYLLSLLPAALLLIGAGVSTLELLRHHRSDTFVLVGLFWAMVFALIYFNLKVPCYASVKSFYALAVLVPLSSFGAIGWTIITRGRKSLQVVAGILLVIWALNSFFSVWVYHSAEQHARMALRFEDGHNFETALLEAQRAVDSDPSNANARTILALILDEASKDSSAAIKQAERAVALAPLDSSNHLELGSLLLKQGERDKATSEARLAVEVGPENVIARHFLSVCLFEHKKDSIAAAEEALAVSPFNAEIHYLLATALGQEGDWVNALRHFAYAVLLKREWEEAHLRIHSTLLALINSPDASKLLHESVSVLPESTIAFDELAWIFATHPDATIRDGDEAVRLAEHTCALTNREEPMLLATLAAAYAETGRLPDAITVVQESLLKARSTGDANALRLGKLLLTSFQSNTPFREDPNQR